MRQILFKAQRVDGKGWVKGTPYYIEKEGVCFIINNCQSLNLTSEYSLFLGIEVIPETVCQYVWITDDDKNKIFQSDKCYFETEDYFDNENATFSEGYKGEVTIEFDEHGVFFRTECNETLHISIWEYLDYKLKLIGNIHNT
jgi:hypothetical protein